MLTYSKYIFHILVALLCLSCAKSPHHEDEYVSFALPEGVVADTIGEGWFKGYNYDKEGELRLSISEIPIGIVPDKARFLAQALGCPWIEGLQPEEDEIGGYQVTVYRDVIKGDYDIYGNTYVFSNGEKSVVLMESLKNDSTSWWKNHLKWNLPKRTELPLAQRTKEFERFINALMEQGIGAEMQIAADSSNVNIRLVVDADSGYQLPNKRKMQRDAWQLINCFDVFAEHAAAKSDFCINIADKSGNDLGSLVLPYMQYAQMEDEPCLTYDEEYEVLEDNSQTN